jgi:hypothetical protein
MDKTQKMTALAGIIAANPHKAEFAASLLGSLAKGKESPKQAAWIDRLIAEAANPAPATTLPALIGAFRSAAATVKFPKVVLTADGVEWTLSYVSPMSEKAKPENRDTIGIASGKFGEPTAKWGGRIGQDGSVVWGKDATPDLVAAVQGIDPSALPLKKK